MVRGRGPVATDIYERQALAAENRGGSVQYDIEDMSLDEMMDYFGDLDPTEFL